MTIENTDLRIQVAVDSDEEAEALTADFQARGGRNIDVDKNGAGIIDPITISILASVTMAFTGFIVWLKDWVGTRGEDGLLIRVPAEGEVQVTAINIPYGEVIVVGKDGQWTKHIATKERLGELVTSLMTGKKSAGGEPTSPAQVAAERGAQATKTGAAGPGSSGKAGETAAAGSRATEAPKGTA